MRVANLNDSMKKIGSLKDYQGDDQIITSYDLQESIKQEPPLKVFNSKIPSLDKAIEGLNQGSLLLLVGRENQERHSLLKASQRALSTRRLKASGFPMS